MANLEQQVANLLGQMTLEEKIELTIGRDFWSTNGVERLGLAPISLNDGPHGVRKPPKGNELGIGNSIPATCFPTAMALAASWDTELVYEIGQALGQECLALDTQVLLGPGVNIKRTPLGGRNFEYFSEDPLLAGEMGGALVQGIQSKGIGTSLKHYACNNQEWERMSISAEVDQRTLREIYLAAFERVVKKARPWTIMAAYNKVNGTFAAEHPQLLQSILKDEWGFEGVVVSDWGAVNEKPKALAAGLDLEMPGPMAKHTEKIGELVRQGALEEAVIDRAASRVIALIIKGNANRKPGATFDRELHHSLVRRAAAESIILLKNSGNLLPLKVEELNSIAVIGQFARQPRYQGSGSSQVVPTRLESTFSELESWLEGRATLTFAPGYGEAQPEQSDEALIAEAVALAEKASVALIFVGLPDSFESEGFDRQHIFMPQSHNRLIEEICKVQPNCVVILHNGSVVAMPWVNSPKAIIEAGLGGQAIGGAIVDVLSGKVNPSGKLAETFPTQLEDTPAYLNYPGEAGTVRYGEGIFVGYRYYDKKKVKPLFPFGYGLSYTTFDYTNLTIDKTEIGSREKLEAKITVRNSGSRPGKEVVQLYIRSLDSQFSRPVKELKAFAKVELAAGETGQVIVSLEDRDFMIFDTDRQSWRLEGGSYEVLVGGSSDRLTLRAEVKIQEDLELSRRVFNKMSPLQWFLQDSKGRELVTLAVAGTPVESWVEGGDEIFTSMPIGKLVNFGQVPETVIENVILKLNQTN